MASVLMSRRGIKNAMAMPKRQYPTVCRMYPPQKLLNPAGMAYPITPTHTPPKITQKMIYLKTLTHLPLKFHRPRRYSQQMLLRPSPEEKVEAHRGKLAIANPQTKPKINPMMDPAVPASFQRSACVQSLPQPAFIRVMKAGSKALSLMLMRQMMKGTATDRPKQIELTVSRTPNEIPLNARANSRQMLSWKRHLQRMSALMECNTPEVT